MKAHARVILPNRTQMEFRASDLESLLPEGHRARLVWSYVAGQDLERFYERIRVREGGVGRAAIAPEILLSLWLYATLDGVGSAREVARLTDAHDAYRWLCGGVQVNYHTLSDFRKDHGDSLDELLSANVATLIAAGVVKLRQVAQDGMRVRASAGAGSFRREDKLAGYLEAATTVINPLARPSAGVTEKFTGSERKRPFADRQSARHGSGDRPPANPAGHRPDGACRLRAGTVRRASVGRPAKGQAEVRPRPVGLEHCAAHRAVLRVARCVCAVASRLCSCTLNNRDLVRRVGQSLESAITNAAGMNALEAESIEVIREAVATGCNPVMLYSIGKDSSVMLHLARKAFYPAPPPFPLLHVDTGWKFAAMYAHRDRMVAESAMTLITHTNPQGLVEGVGPFTHGSNYHTDVMKTQALKQVLDAHGFDVVFGGARRDEEKSRAKERVFSFRAPGHRWDPKAQRPELWNLYNTRIKPGETIRVFPISNWTELDIWQYIYRERIPIVPLYLAAERPVVKHGGQWIMVDDDRFPFAPGEQAEMRRVRFRTLGCWPLTSAIESEADTLEAVIAETFNARSSERQGRLIDSDVPGSMEKKKQEGYF